MATATRPTRKRPTPPAELPKVSGTRAKPGTKTSNRGKSTVTQMDTRRKRPATKPHAHPVVSGAKAPATDVAPTPPAKTVKKAPAKKTTGMKKSLPKKGLSSKISKVTKDTPKNPAPVARNTNSPKRALNELGFVDGTDSAVIAQVLTDGGADRNDVNDRCREAIKKANGLTNRYGQEKYIPSMVSGVLTKMLDSGAWEIEASWQLVPAKKK